MNGHGGELAMAALRGYGVKEIFTLSGGHIFPFYDACVKQEVADLRRPPRADGDLRGRGDGQADPPAGGGRAHRRPGRHQRRERHDDGVVQRLAPGRARRPGRPGPLGVGVAAGARPRPDRRLGHQVGGDGGGRPADIPKVVGEAVGEAPDAAPRARCSSTSRSTWCSARRRTSPVPAAVPPRGAAPDPDLVGGGGRPGARRRRGRAWWRAATCGGTARGRRCATASRRCASRCFANGLGRGCLPADHELAFSRTRSALKEADVVVVVGTPLDFRLSFGRFGDGPGGPRGRLRGRAGPATCPAWCRRPATLPRCSTAWPPAGGPVDLARGVDRLAAGPGAGPAGRRGGAAHRRRRPDPPGPGLRRAAPPARAATPSSSATAATSCPGPAGWSTRSSRAAGWTPAPTAASAPGSATPWPPGSPTPTARWCSCSATGPPASPSWTPTPWSATACRS